MAVSGTATLNGKSVMPSLTVNNLQQSLDFFSGLGFEIEDRWEENGKLLGAMLKAGEARLGLSQDDGKKGTNRVKGVGMRIYIEAADNIDQVAVRADGAKRLSAADGGAGRSLAALRYDAHASGHCLRGRVETAPIAMPSSVPGRRERARFVT